MSCTARSNSGFGGHTHVSGRGRSKSAEAVEGRLREFNADRDRTAVVQLGKRRTQRAIVEIAAECSEADWGGNGELAITEVTVLEALALLEMVPWQMAVAEVVPEPLGSLALEWRAGPSRAIVLSVSGRGSIEYASLLGRNYESHGRVPLTSELPEIVFHQLMMVREA